MRTLSKEAEQKIIDAVKRAVDLVDNDGHSPDAALEKVAREEQWGPEMIRFSCHAYNTGRQTAHRESQKSALDKFAAFPISDPEHIVREIFPDKVKTAADAAYAGVSTGYQLPPSWVTARTAMTKSAALHAGTEKQAAAKSVVATDSTPTQVYDKHLSLKRAVDQARTDVRRTYDQLTNTMGQLADYFKLAEMDRVPFDQFDFAAQAVFGKAGKIASDFVYSRNGMGRKVGKAFNKFASAHDVQYEAGKTKLASFPVLDYAKAPWSLLKAAADLGKTVVSLRAEEDRRVQILEKHADEQLAPLVENKQVKVSWDIVGGTKTAVSYDDLNRRAFLPHRNSEGFAAVKRAADVTLAAAPAKWSIVDGMDKTAAAGGMSDMWATKDLLKQTLGQGPSTEDRVNSAWMDLEDPAHEAQLRQIKTQSMLADLMNDDVIGGHEPHSVLKAYNEVSQMAPRTASQPLAMRSLLRRHLQGNVEPFESKEITDIEKGIKDSHNPVPEAMVPGVPKPKPPEAKAAADNRNILFNLDRDASNLFA